MEDIIYEYEIIDYTEQLEFITEKIETLNENLIIFNNNFVDSIEILTIFIGLVIGLFLGSLFVKVVFRGT